MSAPRTLLPDQLPVLTEVIDMPGAAAPPPEGGLPDEKRTALEGELIGRVMRELELQVDLMLETRLREILAPAIARATDQLMRETREDLAALLGEILSRALVQELSRTRTP